MLLLLTYDQIKVTLMGRISLFSSLTLLDLTKRENLYELKLLNLNQLSATT